MHFQGKSRDGHAAQSAHKAALQHYGKSSGKAMLLLVLGLIVTAVLAVVLYGKYQAYTSAKAQKAQQLITQQEQIIAEQKKALGHLPEQVLSEQGVRNLDSQVYQTSQPRSERIEASIEKQKIESFAPSDNFKCDGRVYCSQMRSYEEALYFLRHCPNVQMDGNGDGVPCERQFNR